MKINWGTGIVIAIGLFMSFILFMVITMMTDNNYDYEMVVDDYYKQEIGFQAELDGRNNAANLSNKLRVEQSLEGILLVFPEEIASQMENGSVTFYRVNKKDLDFEKSIQLSENKMLIPAESLLPGRWDVSVRWEMNGKTYITQDQITF
ncbi:MAG: FixH family protein [Flavobacteriaceae bacterium]|nr:FixH family protein [Flavobacteriaceae bacterium]